MSDLITRFSPQGAVVPSTDPPQFYECGICNHYHPIEWDGDCRDDANRYSIYDLDDKYGAFQWLEVAMPA